MFTLFNALSSGSQRLSIRDRTYSRVLQSTGHFSFPGFSSYSRRDVTSPVNRWPVAKKISRGR